MHSATHNFPKRHKSHHTDVVRKDSGMRTYH